MLSLNYPYWNRKSVKHLLLSLSLIVTMTGCATRPVTENTPEPRPSSENASSAVAQQNNGVTLLPAPVAIITQPIVACEHYSKSDAGNQKKQWSETQQALNKNNQDLLHRIKLACMYALPSSYTKDTAKAQVLLQQLRDEQAIGDAEKAFINHLYLFNAENIKQIQKSRDDAKALETLTQKYEALQKKYDASEQKLQHLKNIEKKLNVR